MNKYQDNPDDDDVIIRLQHDNGVVATFLTAPAELFFDKENLCPMIYWLSETDAYIAFNEDLLNDLIEDSIELNGNAYGKQAAAFLPLQHMIKIGLDKIDK